MATHSSILAWKIILILQFIFSKIFFFIFSKIFILSVFHLINIISLKKKFNISFMSPF